MNKTDQTEETFEIQLYINDEGKIEFYPANQEIVKELQIENAKRILLVMDSKKAQISLTIVRDI